MQAASQEFYPFGAEEDESTIREEWVLTKEEFDYIVRSPGQWERMSTQEIRAVCCDSSTPNRRNRPIDR
jgi:hypothetical protein